MKSGWITAVFVGVIVVGGLAFFLLRGGEVKRPEQPTPAATAQSNPEATQGAAPEGAPEDAGPTPDAMESDTAAAESTETAETRAGAPSESAEADDPVEQASESGAETEGQPENSEIGPAESVEDETPAVSPAEPRPAEASTPAAPGPRFDVVRVERNGDAVIAGWAPPGSRVTLHDGGNDLGSVTADASGNWVLLPNRPLPPGSHELYLTARTRSGDSLQSENSVVVSVPDPQAAVQAAAAPEPAPGPAHGSGAGEPVSGSAPAVTQTTQDASSPGGTTTDRTADEDLSGRTAESAPAAADSAAEPAAAEPAPETVQETIAVLVPRQGEGTSRIFQQPNEEDGIVDQDLVLNAIDYDQHGRVVISGRASPGAQVQVYLDNDLVGRATADAEGRWALRPNERVSSGLHRLRVDQIGDGGTVAARVETPFSRAEALTDLPGETFVIVQPGNSLWRIARKTYGDGFRYSVIYRSNADQIRDPDLIYPGQVFLVPEANRAAEAGN